MHTKRTILLLALTASCVERPAVTASTPLSPQPVATSRASTGPVSTRENALTRALLSRYPASHHTALSKMLEERNGVSKIVQLNDPDSQRLFDQIVDVRLDERALRSQAPSPRARFRRLVVALSQSAGGDAQSARIVKRPATVISGEAVDAQFVLLLPAGISDDVFRSVIAGSRASLARLTASTVADASVRIMLRDMTTGTNSTAGNDQRSELSFLKDGPAQSIEGVGQVRTYPIIIDLLP